MDVLLKCEDKSPVTCHSVLSLLYVCNAHVRIFWAPALCRLPWRAHRQPSTSRLFSRGHGSQGRVRCTVGEVLSGSRRESSMWLWDSLVDSLVEVVLERRLAGVSE